MPAKNPSLKQWLDHYLETNPPRAKSLVMTLFGDVITPHGGQVWLGSLIELLAPFGISDRLVRTSVFRLAEEGWLDARREGRRSQYGLNPASAGRFERAYQRIYSPSHHEWNGKWILLFATSGAITTEQRTSLRKELLWQGFGMIAPSVFARPGNEADILDEVLQRVGVRGAVFACHAIESELPSARPLRELVDQCWEMGTVISDYERFIDVFENVPTLLGAGTGSEPEQAYMLRTLLIHEFRRVQLHDPLLPLELLPERWPGKTAYQLCHDIYQATFAAAESHILSILSKEDEAAREAAPYFYHRFGGLV
ncbi:phenylacetic acid degradation operon negative regulatory protein PaaX [Noviherbaspirillum sp. CPCC 100848]|uniref:Phenylacetic acid degradation operon negative regulatory protein PaaX n=1 Tax=Noviherbaspirillum album TaxID=3080276 RepID=A0ABU6JIG3_9BURK|nr:phenylacetic acid degradation operon negative regulatory protein PaaX [Noviherbaspirillum sp. CPCC 100848]MEC4723488.1 phenylacetic acid degradation operon negative regulatory protein PaaX [Noviherbaspirillum sp. CPCC 100848]